jgi:hypothetical protein
VAAIQRLRDRCEEQGLNQAQLAAILSLRNIARALRVPLAELCDEVAGP